MKKELIDGFPAIRYNLAGYREMIDPFFNLLVDQGAEMFSLGPDGEADKRDVWESDDPIVPIVESIFDGFVLDFLDRVHPQFKGQGQNYWLEKDAWLNTPSTWQGTRIHRHWEPFLKPEDIGDVVTVFYLQVPEEVNEKEGSLCFYEPHPDPEEHYDKSLWLPESLEPSKVIVPQQYDLIMFTSDTWHKAHPFRCERYSLATDLKATVPE